MTFRSRAGLAVTGGGAGPRCMRIAASNRPDAGARRQRSPSRRATPCATSMVTVQPSIDALHRTGARRAGGECQLGLERRDVEAQSVAVDDGIERAGDIGRRARRAGAASRHGDMARRGGEGDRRHAAVFGREGELQQVALLLLHAAEDEAQRGGRGGRVQRHPGGAAAEERVAEVHGLRGETLRARRPGAREQQHPGPAPPSARRRVVIWPHAYCASFHTSTCAGASGLVPTSTRLFGPRRSRTGDAE